MQCGRNALVVLSGGQDSTTALFWAKETFDKVHAITFDYAQRHWIEIHAARTVAALAGVESHEIIVLPPELLRSSSPLVSNSPLETYSGFDHMDKIIGDRTELTFVPMRNALFLTIAANRAIALDCDTIVTGTCQMDVANYPDCREDFIRLQMKTINAALGGSYIDIATPLMFMSKEESVLFAKTLPGCMEALAFSHTCYAGKFPPCGKCHACVLRAHGFEKAGYPDPLVERAEHA